MRRSVIGVIGRFSWNGDQSLPPFQEMNTPSSVPAKSRSRLTSSSRTTLVNALAGMPRSIFVHVAP